MTSSNIIQRSTQAYDKTPLPLNNPLTTLHTKETGFTHTGSGVGTVFKPKPVDPRFNLPTYGNTKPQAIDYFMRKSNLLHN
jgi:hypothetical protein